MVLTFYPPGTASATEPAPESPSEEEQPAVEPAFVMQPPPEFVETPGSDEEPDGISSAAELLSWLESHKFSGGRAALTGDITVNEDAAAVGGDRETYHFRVCRHGAFERRTSHL